MNSIQPPINLWDIQSCFDVLLHRTTTALLVQGLKPSTFADAIAFLLLVIATFGYTTRGRLWDKVSSHHHILFERPQVVGDVTGGRASISRDISHHLEEGTYECVIFWGSQSGTSERFADTLGREALARFGVKALVADISDYDAESISRIAPSKFAIFILSTYGEGDPSDNTSGLWDWVKQDIKVDTLRYLAFGLGNSNYKYYNRVLDVIADALDAAGASALIPRQKADDANGGTNEDFEAWKDHVFALFRQLGYEEKSVTYQPCIDVDFTSEPSHQSSSDIELSVAHQQSTTNSAITPLAIKSARELFTAGDRNCVHLELDLGNSDLVYKTGDHVGIWPINPEEEVDRLLEVLGLQARKTEQLVITPKELSGKTKIPSPTTLETAFRHHLEICAPVARKVVLEVAEFAPTQEARLMLLNLAQDREQYEQFTAATHVTFARLLKLASPVQCWDLLPLPFVIERLQSLQPRYYSISSSSVISPRRIAVTALVVNKPIASADPSAGSIHGLTSNYLLSASSLGHKAASTPIYHRSVVAGSQATRVLAHVRKSKFKLPITSSTALILISAGTGFAPFRAFLQERAKLHTIGKPIGKMMLFFGCRDQDDYIYHEEIEKIQKQLGDKLEVITAFSRSSLQQKLYVQDRVAEHADKVLAMLDAGASMYICGKASMAREVDMKLEEKFKEEKTLDDTQVKAWADGLKKRGKWRADVWG